jgi:hypothetical protein
VVADDQRVYSDEEFALILRKATELASRVDSPGASSSGLTLTEMQAAAAQVGLDPALVARAARMLAATATESPLDRLMGGPVRHEDEAHFPIKLDEDKADRLLSAVRIRAGLAGARDDGHSSAMGMTWHDGGDMEALRITARPEADGTAVSVVLDRRGTLALIAMFSGMAMFLAFLFAVFALYPEAPALGFGGVIAAFAGPLAIARSYWAASTRKVRQRINEVMDGIGQTLAESETQPAALPEPEASRVAITASTAPR